MDLMKLEIEQPTHLVDISRLPLKQDRRFAERRYPNRSAGGELRSRCRSHDSARDIQCYRKRCFLAPRASYETKRQSEAISCSARAARISTTPQRRVTNGHRKRAARHFGALIAYTRSSARVMPVSPLHPSDMAVAMSALEAQIELLEPNQATRCVAIMISIAIRGARRTSKPYCGREK